MKAINNLTKAEFKLYLELLPLAYDLQIEKTGLVCGTKAEELRDKMFHAITKEISFDEFIKQQFNEQPEQAERER